MKKRIPQPKFKSADNPIEREKKDLLDQLGQFAGFKDFSDMFKNMNKEPKDRR